MKSINLSNNLYILRKRRGLSQEEFAEKIHISRQAVSKWERGEALPDIENLIEIAEFYGVTIDELINKDEVIGEVAESPVREDDSKSENEEKKSKIKVTWSFEWKEAPYPIIVALVYLALGFLVPNGCIKARRFTPFAYPVLCAFIYCLYGMLTKVWHPTWLIFLSMPIYYWIAHQIDKAIAAKRGESVTVEAEDGNEDDKDEEE